MKTLFPFCAPPASRFVVGQDAKGHWIAVDDKRRAGGIFVSREAALKYLSSECGLGEENIRWSNEPVTIWN